MSETVSEPRPRKRDYRQRAHCNPLSDSTLNFPLTPDHVDWSLHFPHAYNVKSDSLPSLVVNSKKYPAFYNETPSNSVVNGSAGPKVNFLDIGCGFGGLLVHLSPIFHDKLILGMEIREKVSNFVGERIRALRYEAVQKNSNDYQNISIIRTNATKFVLNYIRKSQLEKIFFCFPDPNFKTKHHRRRIVSYHHLSLYAYLLKEGGLLYAVTDVKDLFDWMYDACVQHPLFVEVDSEHNAQDPCVDAIQNYTDESMKVKRNGFPCYYAVFKRIATPTSEPAS